MPHSQRRMPLFDAYVLVDWSAANAPKTGPDSVWIAHAKREGGRVWHVETLNPATREQAFWWIRALLLDLVSRGSRVLAGFDFSLGYPAGFSAALGAEPSRPAWQFAWNTLH